MGFADAYKNAQPAEKKSGFAPLPDGDYTVWLDSAAFSTTCGKDKNREGIEYQMTVTEGEHYNRKIWKTQYTDRDSAAPYVKADIIVLGLAELPNWNAVCAALPTMNGATLKVNAWTNKAGYKNYEITELLAGPSEKPERDGLTDDDGAPEPEPPVDDADLVF